MHPYGVLLSADHTNRVQVYTGLGVRGGVVRSHELQVYNAVSAAADTGG